MAGIAFLVEAQGDWGERYSSLPCPEDAENPKYFSDIHLSGRQGDTE
jgi:hypothetical protein